MQTANPEQIDLDLITVPANRRPLDDGTVERLVKSIDEIGLRTPLTVLSVNDGERLDLVAGNHRLAAVRKLGWPSVQCFVIEGDKIEAQMWEIAENLHRAELTALQRDEQIAKWIELCEAKWKLAQVAPVSNIGGRGNESGVNKASRDLGIERTDAQRATKVASLTDEAKQAAHDEGLDDNRSALLQAARQAPDAQVSYIREIAEKKRSGVERDVKDRAANEVAEVMAEYVPADAWDMLKANLYAAGAANIANALTNITGNSIMDKRGWK